MAADGLTVTILLVYGGFAGFVAWVVARMPRGGDWPMVTTATVLLLLMFLALIVRGLLDRWQGRAARRVAVHERKGVDALRNSRASRRGGRGRPPPARSAPPPARADIFGDLFGSLKGIGGIISLLEALIGYVYPVEGMDPMPPTIDGRVLAGTQDPIGQAPGSYVTGNAPSRNPLFPPDGNPDWLPPDGASIYANLRLQDRGARADEAEALASAVTRDDQAAPARLDGYVLRNAIPSTIMEDVKLGNDVADRERRPAAQADLAPGGGEPAPGRRAPAARLGGEAGGPIQQGHAGKWLLGGHEDVAARPAA